MQTGLQGPRIGTQKGDHAAFLRTDAMDTGQQNPENDKGNRHQRPPRSSARTLGNAASEAAARASLEQFFKRAGTLASATGRPAGRVAPRVAGAAAIAAATIVAVITIIAPGAGHVHYCAQNRFATRSAVNIFIHSFFIGSTPPEKQCQSEKSVTMSIR